MKISVVCITAMINHIFIQKGNSITENLKSVKQIISALSIITMYMYIWEAVWPSA